MICSADNGLSCSDCGTTVSRIQVPPSGELQATIPTTSTRCQRTRQVFASCSQSPTEATVRDVWVAHQAHVLAAQASLA